MKNILVLLIALLFAVPAYAVDGTALLKQVDRNLNPISYESYRKLINIEPDGRKKEYTLFTVKKGVDKTTKAMENAGNKTSKWLNEKTQ